MTTSTEAETKTETKAKAKKKAKLLLITVGLAELLTQVNKCAAFAAHKTTIPILSNLLVKAEGDHVTLTGTDLQVSLITSFSAKVKSEGSATIPARALLNCLKKVKEAGIGDEITIQELDGHWIVVSCGEFKVKMAGMDEACFPKIPTKLLPEDVAIPTQIGVEVLTTLIRKVKFAIAPEESRYTINGALLEIHPDKLRMVGTDGHRLAKVDYAMETGQPVMSKCLIPTQTLENLLRVMKDSTAKVVEFARQSTGMNELFFRLGDDLIHSKPLTGQYPNYESVLPKGYTFAARLDSVKFSQALTLVAQFADERSKAVKFELLPGKGIRLTTVCTETGEASRMLDGQYEGSAMALGFNCQFVLDWLKVINAGLKKGESAGVVVKVHNPQSAGLFLPAVMGEYDFQTVIMPMRI